MLAFMPACWSRTAAESACSLGITPHVVLEAGRRTKYLSGLAIAGADEASKIGVALPRIFLTENREITECSAKAEA